VSVLAPSFVWQRLFECDKRLEWVNHSPVGDKWVMTNPHEPLKFKINNPLSRIRHRKSATRGRTLMIKRLNNVYTHFELSICGNLPNLAEHNLIVNRGRKNIIFWKIIVMNVIGSNKSCQNGYIHVYSKWHDEPSPRPYPKLNFIQVMSHNNWLITRVLSYYYPFKESK